jgi:PAS domain S-box-containing protein
MNRYWANFRAKFTTRSAKPLSKRELALCVFLIVLYIAAGRWGLTLALIQAHVTAIWLPAGIALAAFLLLGYRVWPAILVASVVIDATYSGNMITAVGVAGSNILEGIVGCYLVRRFAQGTKAFDTAEGVFKFIFFACIVSTAVGATVGGGVFYLVGLSTWDHVGYMWLTWCFSDAVGTLLIAPFLILLFGRPHHPLAWRELLELTVLTLGLMFTCLVVFGPLSESMNKSQLMRASMCIPFLIWAAFRFCQLEAAGLTLILFGTAIWGTLNRVGYFSTPDLNLSLLTLDMFIGVIGTMTLAVAALVTERRGIEANLLGMQSLLQDAVEGKSRDLAAAVEVLRLKEAEHLEGDKALRETGERFRLVVDKVPVVFRLLDPVAKRILYVSPAYETNWGRSCESLYADTHSWLDAVHPEDQELALNFFDRETRNDTLDAEYRIVRPDGSVRWIWDRGFIIRDESGRVSRWAGLASDITERKQLEQGFSGPQGRGPRNGRV